MNEHAFRALLSVFGKDSYFAQARDTFTRVCSLRNLPFNEFVTRYPNEMNRLIAREISIGRFFFLFPADTISLCSLFRLRRLRMAGRELQQGTKKNKSIEPRVSLLALRAWDPRTGPARMGPAIAPTDKPTKKCRYLITSRAVLSTALSEIKCAIRR